MKEVTRTTRRVLWNLATNVETTQIDRDDPVVTGSYLRVELEFDNATEMWTQIDFYLSTWPKNEGLLFWQLTYDEPWGQISAQMRYPNDPQEQERMTTKWRLYTRRVFRMNEP